MTIFNKTFVFFVFITFSSNSVLSFSSAALVPFAERCASAAPEYSTPKRYTGADLSVPRPQVTGFYYIAAGASDSEILSQNPRYGEFQSSVVFRFWYGKPTEEQGLLRVRGILRLPRDATYSHVGNMTSSMVSVVSFKLNGIWSEASGELCMIGSGSGYSNRGNLLKFPAVLKLNKLKNSTSLASLVSGTLKSLITSENDPNYFGPISLSMLPLMNYQYTFVSNNSGNGYSDGSDLPPSSLEIGRFCSVISRLVLNSEFVLKYSSHCLSVKNCSPLTVSYLPHVVSLKNIECLEDEKRLRVLVDFTASSMWHERSFDQSTTLVGEGSWDSKRNQLHVVACRFLNATDSLSTSHVGDCSVRLSLRFAAVWTIGNTSSIVGKIWSSKNVTESGYFENIAFESGQIDAARFALQGQKYEYTRMDEVTNWCLRKKTANDKSNIYPHPYSFDMRFDISAKHSTGESGWGYSIPLSVDNQFYHPYLYSMEDGTEIYPVGPVSAPAYRYNHRNPYNISYKISIKVVEEVKLPKNDLNRTSTEYDMGIFAEGIYDDTEGSLCMVGCRYLHSSSHQEPTNESVDCEIVVKFQFPFKNPKKNSDFIKGSIESTRQKSDPLHFERLELSSVSSDLEVAEESISRMHVEIILVVISNTFACVFGALQLFHVKRHPDVLPSISIVMLFILALGYVIPLMLNFDTMFTQHSHQTLFLGSGWIEFSEEIVRVIKMVGFLLQIRLLQLAVSARSENGNQKELWAVEKLVLFVALLVYVARSIVALLLIYWRETNNMVAMDLINQGHPIVGSVLKSCASLFLDAFLFPQILLNMLTNSTEKALSVSFYIGTTLVRVLPHAYDLYRAHAYATHVPIAWDVITSCGGLLLAGIIYLQQHFADRSILL